MKTNFKGSIRELYAEAANSYTPSDIATLEETIADQTAALADTLKDVLGYKEFSQTKALIDSLTGTISEKAFEIGFRKGMKITLDGLSIH